MTFRGMTGRLRLGAAFGASLTLGAALFAQDFNASKGKAPQTSSSSSSAASETEKPRIRRIWVGATGSCTPLKLVTTSSITNSTTGETISSSAANGQVGGGINLNFRVYGNWWLNASGIYRFTGYDTNDSLNDTNSTYYLERTRARYFDFPLLLRYAGPRFRWSKYSFYEGGGAIREAASISTATAAENYLGYFCCASPSTTNIRRRIEGVVVGTGVVGRDEFGIKVAPEVRYVRWMDDTFRSPTVGSQRDQLEIAITFGY